MSSIDKNEFLSIEGTLDDPKTMLDLTKLSILRKANSRAYEHIKLKKDGFLELNINSGKEIKISEELFDYVVNNLENTNKNIREGKLTPYLDDEKKIRFRRPTEHNINGIARLKNGNIEGDSDSRYNPSEHSDNENLEWLLGLYNSNQYGDMVEFMDMENTNWSANSMGIYSTGGYGTLNGQKAHYRILNNCAGWTDPYACDANYIAYTTYITYSSGSIASHLIIRNPYGDPIATITTYRY